MNLFDFSYLDIPIPVGTRDGVSKRTREKYAKHMNDLVWANTFDILSTDGQSRIDGIDGLPDTCNERIILQSLFWNACFCLVDEKDTLLSLPAAPCADLDIYGDFAKAYVYSKNGKITKQVNLYRKGFDGTEGLLTGVFGIGKPNAVLIWENRNRYPFVRHTMQYSTAIADTFRTLDICRKNLKNPFLIAAEQSVVPTIEEFFNKRDSNVDFILNSGVFDASKISLLPIQTSAENLTACTQQIEWYIARHRELCAFSVNTQLDKKGENLTSAEIHGNDEYIQIRAREMEFILEEELDKANKFFGLNLKIRRKEEVIDNDEENISPDEDGAGGLSADNSGRVEGDN